MQDFDPRNVAKIFYVALSQERLMTSDVKRS